jgi:glycosyltransferase involved in cell wall biosynthesis
MHIRFLIMNAYAGGGTVRTTFTCAAELARRHDVEIVSVYKRGRAQLPLPDGVRLWALSDETREDRSTTELRARVGWQTWASKVPSLLCPRAERRYSNFSLLTDILLVHYLRGLRDGVIVGTRPGLNLITARFAPSAVTSVGQEHLFLGRHKQRLRRKICRGYRRLDMVTTLTTSDADDYRRALAGHARLETVPNPVPALGGIRASGDHNVVVSAGRLAWQKGYDRLIPAYAGIASDHPDWQLQIFGKGIGQASLSALISDLGAERHIRLMGYTNALYDELARAAVFVMSSRFEGFPMVLLEAMGIGLPVVSFDCHNGPRDLIEHGRNGLLVPEGDIEGLGAALSSLMADGPRRRAMGAAARETAKAYDVTIIAQRWESLFSELAAGKR